MKAVALRPSAVMATTQIRVSEVEVGAIELPVAEVGPAVAAVAAGAEVDSVAAEASGAEDSEDKGHLFAKLLTKSTNEAGGSNDAYSSNKFQVEDFSSTVVPGYSDLLLQEGRGKGGSAGHLSFTG